MSVHVEQVDGKITHILSQEDGFFLFKKYTWIAVLKELFFALVIACVVSVGIEATAKKELNNEISENLRRIQENVLAATFGKQIPSELFSETRDLVLKADFVRTRHRAQYVLSVVNLKDLKITSYDLKMIKMVVIVYSTVKNVSGTKKDYDVRLEVEKAPFIELEPLTVIKRIQIGETELGKGSIRFADASERDTDMYKKLHHTVSSIEPGSEINIVTEINSFKFMTDTEVWRSLYPGLNMDLEVQFPPEILKVGASALHRTGARSVLTDSASGRYNWQIDQPVLPHQGMLFWWRECDNSAEHFSRRIAMKDGEISEHGTEPA
ncbi:hypothetical protein [Thalassobaculum sp.]